MSEQPKTVRLSDFPKMFNHDKLSSDLEINSTHTSRSTDEILLSEYIPMKPIGSKGLKIQRSNFGDTNDDSNIFF